ncbi:MAG: ABC transporter ATP-binding protein [Alkalispirochaeta sp.]
MLQLRELTRTFPGMDHPAVDALDLEIATGEVVALAGASGSGKTTTLRLIAGFDRPDDGRVSVHNTLVAGPDRFVPPERRSVGVVFQDFALFPHLTVERNVAFGISNLKGREQRRRVEELLELAGIPDLAARYPHEISGGQQQRVALARALAPRPDVILLDEPFSNLDHTCTHRLLAETRHLLKAGGSTAIVVTHDRYEAFTLSDRIAVLQDGRLEQCGTAEEIYAQPATRHVAEFAGSASFLPVWHGGADTEWTCPLGPVPDDVAVVPAQGGGHLAVVRPHQLNVTCGPCSLGEHNATILDVHFLGAVLAVRLKVTWDSGFEEVLIHVNGPMEGLSAGSPARVDWVPRPMAAAPGGRPVTYESSVAR